MSKLKNPDAKKCSNCGKPLLLKETQSLGKCLECLKKEKEANVLSQSKPTEAKAFTIAEICELANKICVPCKLKETVGCDKADCIVNVRKFVSEADYKALIEMLNDNIDVIEDFQEIILTQDKWIDRLEGENKKLTKTLDAIRGWKKIYGFAIDSDIGYHRLGVLLKEGDKQ